MSFAPKTPFCPLPAYDYFTPVIVVMPGVIQSDRSKYGKTGEISTCIISPKISRLKAHNPYRQPLMRRLSIAARAWQTVAPPAIAGRPPSHSRRLRQLQRQASHREVHDRNFQTALRLPWQRRNARPMLFDGRGVAATLDQGCAWKRRRPRRGRCHPRLWPPHQAGSASRSRSEA